MNTIITIIAVVLFLAFLYWAYRAISFARKYDAKIEGRLAVIGKGKNDDLTWSKSKTTDALFVSNQEDAPKR